MFWYALHLCIIIINSEMMRIFYRYMLAVALDLYQEARNYKLKY